MMAAVRMLKRASASVLLFFLMETGPGAAESCSEGDNGTVRLENWTSGRVLVCWEGEWRGLADGAIRTTQQAKDICQQSGFLQEGVEILEALEESINYTNIYCVVREEDFDNCSNATTPSQYGSNKTTAIECKTQSELTPELIALTTAVPVLLCVILVGAVVVIHFVRKIKRLNVIIHQLIYKQQKLRAGHVDAGLTSTLRSSMYAKPTGSGSTGERSNSLKNAELTLSSGKALAGPSQYSLLGNDKYENVDLKEIKAVQ